MPSPLVVFFVLAVLAVPVIAIIALLIASRTSRELRDLKRRLALKGSLPPEPKRPLPTWEPSPPEPVPPQPAVPVLAELVPEATQPTPAEVAPAKPVAAETDEAPAAKPPEKVPTATPIATLLTGQPGATLERAIGEKWMAWVGAVAVLVGGGLFLKYAFEQGWLSETARVVIMFIVGAAFLVLGEYFQRRQWGPIAQVATGIGIAMEYFAAFASSHNFYALVSQPVSFGFMIIVTAMAIGLAVRYNAITIAVIAFLGGLFTPVMLRTGEDQQVKLMTYILLLDAGVLVLAYFKKWRWLNLLVFLGTVGLFFLWMAEHYSPVKMDRTLGFLTAFFVLFSATTIVYHFLGKIRAREDDIVLVVLNAMWALFTAYGLLENHQVKLMTYVLLLDVCVLALAYFKKWRWLNIVMFLGTVCVFFMWMVKHYDSNRLGPTLAFLAGFFALFSATTIVYHFLSKIRDREDDLIMLFLNGAWAFFTAYGLLYDDYHIFVGPMAVVLGAAYLGMALMVRKINANQRHLALTMIAMALGFLTIAIPIHLEGHWITISWAVEAAVLLAIGIALRDLKIRIASFVVYMLMAGCLLYYVEDVGRVMDNLLLNKRCLTFGICIASLIVSYRMLQRLKGVGKDEQLVASTIFGVVAHVFALWLLTMETRDFFNRPDWTFMTNHAKQLTISSTYTLYAAVALFAGFWRRCVWLRITALVLFALVTAKVFMFDLSYLKAIYRIVSMAGLGVLLLAASLLYHKYRHVLEPAAAEPVQDKEPNNVQDS